MWVWANSADRKEIKFYQEDLIGLRSTLVVEGQKGDKKRKKEKNTQLFFEEKRKWKLSCGIR